MQQMKHRSRGIKGYFTTLFMVYECILLLLFKGHIPQKINSVATLLSTYNPVKSNTTTMK